MDSKFVWGVIVGAGGYYLLHKFRPMGAKRS